MERTQGMKWALGYTVSYRPIRTVMWRPVESGAQFTTEFTELIKKSHSDGL